MRLRSHDDGGSADDDEVEGRSQRLEERAFEIADEDRHDVAVARAGLRVEDDRRERAAVAGASRGGAVDALGDVLLEPDVVDHAAADLIDLARARLVDADGL